LRTAYYVCGTVDRTEKVPGSPGNLILQI
jgi:hypothetical protein